MKDISWLFHYLLSLSESDSFVEFKHNFDKLKFGRNISALSNIALLKWEDFWYIVYGIEDWTKNIVWTDFDPNDYKVWNQPLQLRVTNKITPEIDINYYHLDVDDKKVVIVEIPAATNMPIRYENEWYIRIWEATVELKKHPELEQKIWNNEKNRNFEKSKILSWLTTQNVLNLLDYDKYFRLTKQQLPQNTDWFVERLVQEKFVIKENDWSYSITALWWILFANNMNDFPMIDGKTIRVISYRWNTRDERKTEIEPQSWYACCLEQIMSDVINLAWKNEVITASLRMDDKKYPDVTLREFIVNSLIHQDFSIQWTHPLIEIFDNRIEITNAWAPLIDTDRFIDHPPRSRNPDLSKRMRLFGFCEESGSWVDRALSQIEIYQLPAPKFEVYDNSSTKVTIFSSKKLSEMSDKDKVRACYQHCVLLYLKGEGMMQNATLRERLNIPETNYPAASKIIKNTLKEWKIKPGEKQNEYIPRRA